MTHRPSPWPARSPTSTPRAGRVFSDYRTRKAANTLRQQDGGLSAHDLRHYWATRAARSGTPLDRLQDAGGWASPATPALRRAQRGASVPLRYVESAKIANQGVLLGELR